MLLASRKQRLAKSGTLQLAVHKQEVKEKSRSVVREHLNALRIGTSARARTRQRTHVQGRPSPFCS
eukprot:6058536-Pleurochrysis_carterae.AAC.1